MQGLFGRGAVMWPVLESCRATGDWGRGETSDMALCAEGLTTYEAFTGTTTGRGFALYHDARTTLLYTYEASTVCRGRSDQGTVGRVLRGHGLRLLYMLEASILYIGV